MVHGDAQRSICLVDGAIGKYGQLLEGPASKEKQKKKQRQIHETINYKWGREGNILPVSFAVCISFALAHTQLHLLGSQLGGAGCGRGCCSCCSASPLASSRSHGRLLGPSTAAQRIVVAMRRLQLGVECRLRCWHPCTIARAGCTSTTATPAATAALCQRQYSRRCMTPQLCIVRNGTGHRLPHNQQQLDAGIHGTHSLWYLQRGNGIEL